jgi:transposase
VCRLHTVLCELVPGGVRRQLRTSQAAAVVDGIVADSPVAQAKLELARDLVADLQRIDAQRREVKRRVARAVAAAPTSITDVYGVGPIVAACVLGYVRDIRRFPSRDRFASYNGTAPIEVSSGDRKIYRLSRRGNRQLNHAIHAVAVSQISHPGSDGHAYYHRKRAAGMTGKCALRALKRKISDTLYERMLHDVRRREDPGGHSGNDAVSSVAGSHPDRPALRISHSRATANSKTTSSDQRLLTSPPAPDKRRTSRSGTGVKLQPRPRPRRGRGQERA